MSYCDWDDDHGVSEPDISWWGVMLIYGVAIGATVVALPLCGIVWLWCKARRNMRGWVWGVLLVATGVFLGGLAVKFFWWWVVLGEMP